MTRATVGYRACERSAAPCPAPVSITMEGANQQVSGTVRDIGGNTSTVTVAINLDETPPTVMASRLPAASAAGWNNNNVTVTFIGNDGLSGIAACSAPVTVGTEGRNQGASGTCTDVAGNVSPPVTLTGINIDKTPPVLTVTSPANGATVTTSALTLNGTATDPLSGLAALTCNGIGVGQLQSPFSCSLNLNVGANPIFVSATDAAGNTKTFDLSVSYTPPAITSVNPNTGKQWNCDAYSPK